LPTMHITRVGYEKLREKLNYLVNVRRKEIAKQLETARSFGDLSENAEYETAKQEQALNEAKISELVSQLSSAAILDDQNIAHDKAYIGATVKLLDLKEKEEIVYMLVSEAEADFLEGKISITSPVGKALLGKSEQDVVEIQVPAGQLVYRILQISR
jgi:transcription elongation factor GreA